MKKLVAFLAVALVTVFTLFPPVAAAQGPTIVTGGGTGTFGADLDGDGDIDSSHFGFVVVLRGGSSAQGHFECNMAGNADIFGLRVMAVQGQVSQGDVNANGSVSFSGNGTLNVNGKTSPVHFAVTTKAGGPGSGTLQLTVTDPGGSVIAAFPVETVATGGIKIN